MRPLLAAHRDELPHPDDIGEHHGFDDLRPDRPFPSEDFPQPDGWPWESMEGDPDEDLMERTWSDGFIPLRDFGCGQYDVIVVTGPEAGRIWTLTDVGVGIIPDSEMGDRLDHQVGWVRTWDVPPVPERGESSAREGRAREKTMKLVSDQCPSGVRVAYQPLGATTVRVNAHLPGAVVRNIDLSPGAKRKTYDALVHTFPINRPRELRTVARMGVPADALGSLLSEDV